MRIAVLSDAHANREALVAVQESLQGLEVDTILYLGDAVGYNADPDYCVSRVLDVAAAAVRARTGPRSSRSTPSRAWAGPSVSKPTSGRSSVPSYGSPPARTGVSPNWSKKRADAGRTGSWPWATTVS